MWGSAPSLRRSRQAGGWKRSRRSVHLFLAPHHFLRVALSATRPGEAFNALAAVKRILAANGYKLEDVRSALRTKITDPVALLEFTVMTIIDQITDHVHARKRLPNRRAATSFDFEHNGIRFVATYSPFADGGVGEIFISNHKAGSHLNACVRDLGVAASLALQFGCSLDTLRRALAAQCRWQPRDGARRRARHH